MQADSKQADVEAFLQSVTERQVHRRFKSEREAENRLVRLSVGLHEQGKD